MSNIEPEKVLDSLVYLYDLSKIGAKKTVPKNVKSLRITQALLDSHCPSFSARTSTIAWCVCFSAFKKDNPDKSMEDFRQSYVMTPAGHNAYKQALEEVSKILPEKITSSELRHYVKDVENIEDDKAI